MLFNIEHNGKLNPHTASREEILDAINKIIQIDNVIEENDKKILEQYRRRGPSLNQNRFKYLKSECFMPIIIPEVIQRHGSSYGCGWERDFVFALDISCNKVKLFVKRQYWGAWSEISTRLSKNTLFTFYHTLLSKASCPNIQRIRKEIRSELLNMGTENKIFKLTNNHFTKISGIKYNVKNHIFDVDTENLYFNVNTLPFYSTTKQHIRLNNIEQQISFLRKYWGIEQITQTELETRKVEVDNIIKASIECHIQNGNELMAQFSRTNSTVNTN